MQSQPFLAPWEHDVFTALAITALPAGRHFPAAGAATVARAESDVANLGPVPGAGLKAGLAALEAASRLKTGHGFASLPLGRRLSVLESWNEGEVGRVALRALLAPLKLAFFSDEGVHGSLGCRHHVDQPLQSERAAWEGQIVDGRSLDQDAELECDVVVVGTGAGGAAIAKELAEAGHAVLMLEEGQHFTRKDFTGRPVEMLRKLYRKGGLTVAVGNTAIPIPVGKGVGGTTMVNSGTCFRAPESTFAEWRSRFGLQELSSTSMDRYYTRVESMLQVEPARMRDVGGPGRVIARGCEVLGYSHQPLARNAPGCDAQGLCCFGCPTDAKRSTNVSYVPAALARSAQLMTAVKVERILRDGDRAVGVAGMVDAPGQPPRRVTVRAQIVVLACGTLSTPLLLLKNGIANASGQVGRNLSIHPATSAFGVFDESIDGSRTIPQGYAVDHFRNEGIMFEGGSAPLEILASSHTGFGPAFVDLFERFDQLAQFGFMVKDTSRGRVVSGPDGEPFMTYRVNGEDMTRVRRGMEILARIFFAGGAREVHTSIFGFERLRSLRDVETLATASIAPRHVDLSAYHPLGTCRMGRDPFTSVVDPTHETHDIHNLFITDGSSVPGSLGVNPQMTIMAMATRAAEFVSRRLERLHARAAA
jgi:choline dehydrogenase-like flavoprotein